MGANRNVRLFFCADIKGRLSITSDKFQIRETYGMEDLLLLMRRLRGADGCPWDREQDHHSIRKNFLEETYEVLEAIDNEDPALLQEELGDVLLQVVFHAEMEQEKGRFGFADVCDGICKKLVQRHPHVFGSVNVSGTGEVLTNWDKIKEASKGQTTYTETLNSVPRVLPALMRSEKVQHRAAKSGFDYPGAPEAMKDLESEVAELREAMAEKDQPHIEEELGDLLFAAVNVSRFVGADAEESLSKACDKFIGRFALVERLAGERGLSMKDQSLEELDKLWREAKKLSL